MHELFTLEYLSDIEILQQVIKINAQMAWKTTDGRTIKELGASEVIEILTSGLCDDTDGVCFLNLLF